MSDRVTVKRKELEGFLAENQKLVDRSQALMNRIDQLENENKQLRNELQPSSPPEKRSWHAIASPLFARALYYATALGVIVIASWYVFATFLMPIVFPSTASAPAPAPPYP
jgi:hypothetical protein